MKHTIEFKKSAVEKYLTRGHRTVNEILHEIGIASPTIYQWRDQFANVSGMTKSTKPQARSSNEKFNALMEFSALPIDKRGEYLRKNGLHEEHLIEWRKQIEEAFTPRKITSHRRTAGGGICVL